MGKTWILIAHRSGARLFENRGPGKGLNLLEQLEHPAGRLKNHEIDSDKPGRRFTPRGEARQGMGHDQEPVAHVTERFAKQLSVLLDQGRCLQRYNQLVLVAEPRFLGNLRAALTPRTAAMVTNSLGKDLGPIETRELPSYLGDVIRL
jgi:protein required for attachment to host cells